MNRIAVASGARFNMGTKTRDIGLSGGLMVEMSDEKIAALQRRNRSCLVVGER
jgi:hypothetical protein